MDPALEVFRMVFIVHHQPAKVEPTGEESFDFPAPFVAPQRSAILRGHPAIDFVGRNQFGAEVLKDLLAHLVAVVNLVPDQAFRHVGYETLLQGRREQRGCC